MEFTATFTSELLVNPLIAVTFFCCCQEVTAASDFCGTHHCILFLLHTTNLESIFNEQNPKKLLHYRLPFHALLITVSGSKWCLIGFLPLIPCWPLLYPK